MAPGLFKKYDIDPSEAEAWISNGILWAEEARSWKEDGFPDPVVAGKWHSLIRTGADGRWDSKD